MEQYGGNSHKMKDEQKALPEKSSEEKKFGKVISGSAKSKKKGEMQKFADVFISEDVGNVKSYIFMEVLVPAVKKAISDIVTNGVDMILYGETRQKKNTTTKVSYGKYYGNSGEQERRSSSYRQSGRIGFDYDEIIFETRGDAESVLDAMNEIISQYGVVSVGDLYDLADVSTDNFAVNKYGWTDIAGCKAVRVRDGYVLKLPKAYPLN